MNKARIYAAWDMSDIYMHMNEIPEYMGDGEVSKNERLDLLEELEDYLAAKGTRLKEDNVYTIEIKDNPWTLSKHVIESIYKVDNATIFLRHVSHRDDWPPLANPEREEVAIRVYSPEDISQLVKNIKDKMRLIPEISEKPKRILPYGMRRLT